MKPRTIFSILINLLFFLIWIVLVGVTIWPITGIYSETNWWQGGGALGNAYYTSWGGILGAIGLVIHLVILWKCENISPKLAKRVGFGAALIGVVLTGLCLPFFIVPLTTGDRAKAEFAKTYGTLWEARIRPVTDGSWLDEPVSAFQSFGHLPYNHSAYTLTLDVEFLKRGNDSFKCDIYLPTGSGPFPVMIEIHGGGWVGGDKNAAFRYQKEYFAAQGYAIFCVQYGAKAENGMSRQYNMQEIMDNLASFSDWLAQPTQRDQYHLNLSRVFTNGYSAGGHLSALVGVARFNLTSWNSAVNVIGAIDYYGIADLRHWAALSPSWFNVTGVSNLSLTTDYSQLDKYNPMTYVEYPRYPGNSIAPLLVLHGNADSIVPVAQSQELDMMCDARGWPCTYIEIPKGEHCFEADSNGPMTQITLWAMERFMQLC
jgi:acetyl esterase/lipase